MTKQKIRTIKTCPKEGTITRSRARRAVKKAMAEGIKKEMTSKETIEAVAEAILKENHKMFLSSTQGGHNGCAKAAIEAYKRSDEAILEATLSKFYKLELDAIKKDLDKAIKALEFYDEAKNWLDEDGKAITPKGTMITADLGVVAHIALKEIKGDE